jgi:hypothetical protein
MRLQKDETFPGAALATLRPARYETVMVGFSGRHAAGTSGRIAVGALAFVLIAAHPAALRSQDAPPAAPATAACTKQDFETVVDQAASALRDLNLQNRPRFQEKLRQLKTHRAWTDEQFMQEAAPFVKDPQIDTFDQRTNDLLGRIASMGDEGTASATPDCGLYQVLRGHMNQLVETQNAKWSYMFSKIDTELAK